MDGRVQLPVIRFLQKRFAKAYVDLITEAGPIRILAEQTDRLKVESIHQRLEISVKYHSSQNLAVVGHYDCAGNPVGKEEQKIQIKESIRLLKKQFPQLNIIGLWVDENWQVNELK